MPHHPSIGSWLYHTQDHAPSRSFTRRIMFPHNNNQFGFDETTFPPIRFATNSLHPKLPHLLKAQLAKGKKCRPMCILSCVFVRACVRVCLSLIRALTLSPCLYRCLYLPLCVSLLSLSIPLRMFVSLTLCLSFSVSVCLSGSLSVCLSVSLSFAFSLSSALPWICFEFREMRTDNPAAIHATRHTNRQDSQANKKETRKQVGTLAQTHTDIQTRTRTQILTHRAIRNQTRGHSYAHRQTQARIGKGTAPSQDKTSRRLILSIVGHFEGERKTSHREDFPSLCRQIPKRRRPQQVIDGVKILKRSVQGMKSQDRDIRQIALSKPGKQFGSRGP